MTAYSVSTSNPAEQTIKASTAATLPEELFSIEEDDEPNTAEPQQQQKSMPACNEAGMSFIT